MQIQSFELSQNSEDIQQQRRSQALEKDQHNYNSVIQLFNQLRSVLIKIV